MSTPPRPSFPLYVPFPYMKVGRYYTSQKYANHWDAFDLDTEDGRRFAQNGGQRVCTVLVYLNDVASGGCTGFPRLGMRVQPRKGWFWVDPRNFVSRSQFPFRSTFWSSVPGSVSVPIQVSVSVPVSGRGSGRGAGSGSGRGAGSDSILCLIVNSRTVG